MPTLLTAPERVFSPEPTGWNGVEHIAMRAWSPFTPAEDYEAAQSGAFQRLGDEEYKAIRSLFEAMAGEFGSLTEAIRSIRSELSKSKNQEGG